jgi:hypothetical protein
MKAGSFSLDKVLPVAAGIGGGSADAAAALRLLAQLNGLALDDRRIIEVAQLTGADVPVCVRSLACVMTGVGETLQPLSLPKMPCVMVNPCVPVATRDVFGDDALGLALTRPMHVYGGTGIVRAATDVDAAGNLTFGSEKIGFAEATPETDLEVGYTKSFLAGKVSLQSNAAYQMDVAGQTGRNAATFVTRLKIAL